MGPVEINSLDTRFPPKFRERMGSDAPTQFSALGNLDLLALPKTAIFCSARCPGDVILGAYDQASRWRDAGRCVISGFHSPVEQECLRILLRGSPPIIICPARALPKRILADWQKPLGEGRLLILSAFTEVKNRPTAGLASRRNEIVAALADEGWFAHVTPGGKNESLCRKLAQWNLPTTTIKRRQE